MPGQAVDGRDLQEGQRLQKRYEQDHCGAPWESKGGQNQAEEGQGEEGADADAGEGEEGKDGAGEEGT